MAKYLVVATPEELNLPAAKEATDRVAIITGIGGTNVIRALCDIPRGADILNVGYCGSPDLPIGTAVRIGSVKTYHPGYDFPEVTYYLAAGTKYSHPCLTAGDFVAGGAAVPAGAVVDMELAFIAALGFKELTAVKYVSDNLSVEQYNAAVRG